MGAISEAEGHHPGLLTEWGKVTVTWWSHSIKGLHRNDFIMAARTDEAAKDKVGAQAQRAGAARRLGGASAAFTQQRRTSAQHQLADQLHFDAIGRVPGDPILGLMELYAQDPNPLKFDLGVGVYKDDQLM